MGASDGPEFFRSGKSEEAGKFAHIDLVGAAGFLIGEVRQPFQLGWHIGQVFKLRRHLHPNKFNTSTRFFTGGSMLAVMGHIRAEKESVHS
jgi:hypothetical protein